MANNEILSEIKRAEEDARKAIGEAIENKNRMIAEARAEARRIAEDGEEEAVRASQDALRKGEAEIASNRASIVQDGVRQADSLAVRSQSNLSKANTYLLEEFEREIRV